jgi:hypothetical protein
MLASNALSSIPAGLRDPLIAEYNCIMQNYMERRWSPSELSGGRFCEIVYTILDGMGNNNYPLSPSKPSNMVDACRALENHSSLPRSLRILIPRILPSLYEIRNNRGVGHVGGDVDPNHMDCNVVIGICTWIMAELIRVLHSVTTQEAQKLVDTIVELRTPLVWEKNSVKRVLDPNLSIKDQALILLASQTEELPADTLMSWLDYTNKQYFIKLLNQLHKTRYIEFDRVKKTILILPPGSKYVSKIFQKIELQT